MTISGTQIFCIAAVAILSLAAYVAHRFSGPPFLVQRWANDNGFRIVRAEYRRFFKGPFTWKLLGRFEWVYYVRIRELDGRERSAWLRCTDISVLADAKTEVVWEYDS